MSNEVDTAKSSIIDSITRVARSALRVGTIVIAGTFAVNAVGAERESATLDSTRHVEIFVQDEVYYLDELTYEERSIVQRAIDNVGRAVVDTCTLTSLDTGKVAECWGDDGETATGFHVQRPDADARDGCVFTAGHWSCEFGKTAGCIDWTFDPPKACAHACPCNSTD